MQIVLRQTFLLGRFHANPWLAFPFEDVHGEWPPSPWRLLRAILARSHQLEREYAIDCQAWREALVRAFRTTRFSWHLPAFSWRGPGIGQYQPATFEWDPPNRTKRLRGQTVNVPGEKRYRSTLTRDNFWVVGRSKTHSDVGVVWWLLKGNGWSEDQLGWLDDSLGRMTYFGRAESLTEIERVDRLPNNVRINCTLNPLPSSHSVPVLAPTDDATLEQVQAITEDPSVKDSTVPPGAGWLYAKRAPRPATRLPRPTRRTKSPTRLVQFALGARVSPPRQSIVVLTQRFRGRVIREFLGESWRQASTAKKESACLLTGKEADGSPLRHHRHRHARFGILFDKETGRATRLLVWRDLPFDDTEQHAILSAAEQELQLAFGGGAGTRDPWAVRLVPLDSQVLPPLGFGDQAYRCWETVAPYVPPRHVYSRRGRIKAGEGAGEQLRLELVRQGYETTGLAIQVDERDFEWTRVHRPRRNRHEATNTDRRGYQVSLTFDTPVSGPISLGHSSHFGLGLFVALAD